MKSRYLLLLLFIFQFPIQAQQPGQKLVSKIQAQRVAFFTDKMNITPAEAEKFWPIYNEYSQKKNKITVEKNSLTKLYVSNSATMAEKDADEAIKKYVQLVKQETELFESYNKKFRDVLSAHKVMKLYLAEFQFREWLLRQIKESKIKGLEEAE